MEEEKEKTFKNLKTGDSVLVLTRNGLSKEEVTCLHSYLRVDIKLPQGRYVVPSSNKALITPDLVMVMFDREGIKDLWGHLQESSNECSPVWLLKVTEKLRELEEDEEENI